MKQEYRYSVEVLSEVGFNTYEELVVYQTNCRVSADDVATQNNGSVIEHHISEKEVL